MKKKLLTNILMILILLGGASTAFAVTAPTAPTWSSPGDIVFTPNEIGIYWNASTSSVGLAGYYIYRCQGTNCTLPSLPTFTVNDPTVTFYGDATLSAGTSYSYAVAAYDSSGNISAQSGIISDTTQGTVSSIVPVITLTSPSTGVGTVGETFTYSMAQSNLGAGGLVHGNANYSFNWDFGDGGNVNGSYNGPTSITHQYTSPGTYVLTLTVFDINTGDQAFIQQNITVTPASISGLVLRLRFNGDIKDYSGNQLQTSSGGTEYPELPPFANGEAGHGLYLDGSTGGAYVDVKNNAALDGVSALTLSLYAQKNVATASGTILSKQGQYSISVASQGVTATLTNSIGTTVTLSAPSVLNNNIFFHHYAVTYNGTTAILYFDGAAVATQSFSGTIATQTANDLYLGSSGPSTSTFNGSLDWVRVYNQALTLTQIQFLYDGTDFGDVNGGGGNPTSAYDAYLTAEYVVGLITLNTAQLAQAEVNNDQATGPIIYDAYLIAEKSIDLILKLPSDLIEE